ncbi:MULTISPECIES: hypothetical protein [Streptosporangium]
MDTPRPGDDRHQKVRTGLAVIRFILWICWIAWLLMTDHATH